MQGPATSLAYEPAEANVMARPPRDISSERLVSLPLLAYSYIIVGLTESLVCMGAYLWVFNRAGIKSRDIWLVPPADGTWQSRVENIEQPAQLESNPGVFISPEQQELIVRQVLHCHYVHVSC
jgi:Cation transporting ATPase, C-terminus